MEEMAGDDMDPFLSQIRDNVETVSGDMAMLVGDDDEEDANMKKIADSVCVLAYAADDDGWGNVRIFCLIHLSDTYETAFSRFLTSKSYPGSTL
jgi:hypothetical protein